MKCEIKKLWIKAFVLSVLITVTFSISIPAAEFSADYKQSIGTGKPHIWKTYVKGKMRRDDPQNPNGLTTIIRLDKGKTWFLRPAAKAYVESPTNCRSALDKLKDMGNVKRDGISKVATYLCDKYTYQNTQLKMSGTVYYSPKLQTELKREMRFYFTTGSQKHFDGINQLSNIKPGKQPDALFNIPKGYKKVKMSIQDLMLLPNYKAQKKAPMVNLNNGT